MNSQRLRRLRSPFFVLAMISAVMLTSLGFSCPAFAVYFDASLGLDYTYFAYNEVLTAPAKSSETALFPQVVVQARMYYWNDSFIQIRSEFAAWVQSQYNGASLPSSTDSTVEPVETIDPLGFLNLEIDAYFAVAERLYLYIGYGYRNWDRFLSGGNGYREIYTWFYMPVGARFWFLKEDSNPVDIGLDASLRPTSNGKIAVITSETYSNGQDSTMNLGAKMGYRIAMPVRWFANEHWSVEGSAWYEHSEIGQSNLVANSTLASQAGTGILEPPSKTDQAGIDALLTYTF